MWDPAKAGLRRIFILTAYIRKKEINDLSFQFNKLEKGKLNIKWKERIKIRAENQ